MLQRCDDRDVHHVVAIIKLLRRGGQFDKVEDTLLISRTQRCEGRDVHVVAVAVLVFV